MTQYTPWPLHFQNLPAIIPVERLLRSYCFRSGRLSISTNIVGVPYNDVHLWKTKTPFFKEMYPVICQSTNLSCWIALTASFALNAGLGKTQAAPCAAAVNTPTTHPEQWYSGVGTHMVCGLDCSKIKSVFLLLKILPCVPFRYIPI